MTLYRHFPSKEALFEGLVTAMCEYMREGLENAPLADPDQPGATSRTSCTLSRRRSSSRTRWRSIA